MNMEVVNSKRAQIAARERDLAHITRMGTAALDFESQLYAVISNYTGLKVRGGQGTGIVVAQDGAGRVFKVEITQVDGPE